MRTVLVTFGLIVCAIVVFEGDQRKAKTHTITIEGMRFQPEVLTVERGDTIVWVNKDLFPHTVTAWSGPFDSGDIATGKSWSYTVKAEGLFGYFCTYHPTMKGTLRRRSNTLKL